MKRKSERQTMPDSPTSIRAARDSSGEAARHVAPSEVADPTPVALLSTEISTDSPTKRGVV